MELGETEEDTAYREVMEEVGMSIHLCPNFKGEATYPVGVGQKTVVLFLAEAPRTPIVRSQEILTTRWISLKEAEKLLHSSYLEPLRAAEQYLLQSK
jgi:NADH pyrophosphatase NudC (nudix superfamily)